MVAVGFLPHNLSGLLPYVRYHIIVNMLNVLLNKTFLSFLPFLPYLSVSVKINTNRSSKFKLICDTIVLDIDRLLLPAVQSLLVSALWSAGNHCEKTAH